MAIGTALTLTYKKHFSVEPKAQFITTIIQIVRLLRASCELFEIYPEMTEEGNLHYHLICLIKDKIKWYKSVLPSFKRNGFVKIKKIFNIDKWREYCNKERATMEELLGVKIPLTRETTKGFVKKIRKTSDEEVKKLDNILRYYHISY